MPALLVGVEWVDKVAERLPVLATCTAEVIPNGCSEPVLGLSVVFGHQLDLVNRHSCRSALVEQRDLMTQKLAVFRSSF